LDPKETVKNNYHSRISPDDFFELLLDELKQNSRLQGYYRFLSSDSGFLFRKAYFVERLRFIQEHITDKSSVIWDCGSGYGTTCLFLGLNGFKTFGSTLEYYFQEIPNRLDYWRQYGNVNLFTTSYEDIFDSHPADASIDVIILQDTLHHLEPLQQALTIFNKVLKPDGKIILVEENGSNIIQNVKLFMKRGNKRVIEYWDEKLGKKVMMGNENIRGINSWNHEFEKQNLRIVPEATNYVRLLPPFIFNNENYDRLIEKERAIWKNNALLKKYFYFGINMVVEKQK
jgi:SAM-dependent methyltransferase